MNDQAREDGIDVRTIEVGRQPLCVATTRGPAGRPPLLLFNGIGANWQFAKPFLDALTNTTAIIFDVPGVGGSPLPRLPYRPSTLARLAAGLVAELGHQQVDVAGVSWGGGIAQQFAHQYRRHVPTAGIGGDLAGRDHGPRQTLGALETRDAAPLCRPQLHAQHRRRNLRRSVPRRPGAHREHARAMSGASNLGYLYQLLAMTGWTSLPWLWSLRQPTLVLMGRDDPLVPPVNGRILARLIPNARLQMIDDGHLFMVTRPAETAKTIEAFLNEQ